jgi:RNA polymerase sigma-70 factor (ECF subfamily)
VRAIGSLPVGEREVVQLRFLLDLDEKSIAEIVGCPLGTVKVRLHRARKHLRERALRELDGYLPERQTLGASSHV